MTAAVLVCLGVIVFACLFVAVGCLFCCCGDGGAGDDGDGDDADYVFACLLTTHDSQLSPIRLFLLPLRTGRVLLSCKYVSYSRSLHMPRGNANCCEGACADGNYVGIPSHFSAADNGNGVMSMDL